MPVQINEVIIRAIITNDDTKAKSGAPSPDQTSGDGELVNRTAVLNLIDEVLKNQKER